MNMAFDYRVTLVKTLVTFILMAGFCGSTIAEEKSQKLLPSEGAVAKRSEGGVAKKDAGCVTLNGMNPINIVELKDGSLITESGLRSTDHGITWAKSDTFKVPPACLGITRLPNGELGALTGGWTLEQALGNGGNAWHFCWSSDEGKTWSNQVEVTLPGLTMGLAGAFVPFSDGQRIGVVTYSQMLGSGFDKRGASWGNFKGKRIQVETEAHYPQAEACRFYYSDDNGRNWKACDGWIMGWRDNRYTDLFTEGDAVELKDGRILMIGRTANGRLDQAISSDRGQTWWPGGQPMELASSYSAGRVKRLSKTGDLLIVWNQASREETRKGYRRSRLSTAISNDEGKTWDHFKNLEAIDSMAKVTHIVPDADLSPVWGDDEVGDLPDDFALFHYPNVSIADDKVFISYFTHDANGVPLPDTGGSRMKIVPVEWFYQ